MNQYFTYDSQILWNRNAWDGKIGPANRLVRWMSKEGLYRDDPDDVVTDPLTPLPDGASVHPKQGCVLLTETLGRWEKEGLIFECGHAGEHWEVLVPKDVKEGQRHDPKVLTVIRDCDIDNRYWAMDTLRIYESYCELAAREKMLLLFVVTRDTSRIDLAILIMREISQRYGIDFSKLYMDVTHAVKRGRKLREIPALDMLGRDGKVLDDPDSAVVMLGEGIYGVDVSTQWITCESLEFANFTPGRIGSVPFDYERMVHSLAGRKMADAMVLEYDYVTGEDAGLQKHLDRLGLKYTYKEENGRGWVTLIARSALEHPERPLPCMLILQEISKADPHSIPSAFSLWYEYLLMAAMEEMMLVFFVLEDADSNDFLCSILEYTAEDFPMLDRDRVYITGHSHNGHYSLEFTVRHPELIAGVATLGNPHGVGSVANASVTADGIEKLRAMDIPLINIDGQWENGFSCSQLKDGDAKYLSDEEKVLFWRNRLRAWNCPDVPKEKILGAINSKDLVTRMLGVPTDYRNVVYIDGNECYMGDIVNNEGKVHLRVVTIQNLPHATSPHMAWLSWTFLRRFAKDRVNGGTAERY